jgi:deoxyribodipyrimidine photo-lyase
MTFFPILSHAQLVEKVRNFDAVAYCKTRNYLTGWVSQLSPYITHGVITIDEIVKISLERYSIDQAEMRYKELLRREYFTQVHWRKWEEIFQDMECDKTSIPKQEILPEEVQTKIFSSERVNQTIVQLETTWYLHNHQRMRLASYLTHRQKLHWKKCADRTYYHFLDGELWPNHLSRQRVQSTFSHKPYFMNEENLTRYWKIKDPIYQWSYETIEKKIFDHKRGTDVRNSNDIHTQLRTDLSNIPTAHGSYNGYTVLTPRDFHPNKITNPVATVCILDHNFFKHHPWSPKRIAFIQMYCDLYAIPLLQWSISEIISASHDITLFETRNPLYRQTYEQASQKTDVTVHAHKRASPIVRQSWTKKFFPFREKTAPWL